MDSELWTTGEMLDNLKEGDRAVSEHGAWTVRWVSGKLRFQNIRGGKEEPFSERLLGVKWRKKQVEYVSFHEAMVALENGFDVAFYENGEEVDEMNRNHECMGLEQYTWGELVKGTWGVKE